MLGNSLDGTFFWSMSWKMWSEVDLKPFWRKKNMFLGSRKSIWGPKGPISEGYELNLTNWGLFRLGNSLDEPFSWSMSWEMWPGVELKDFRHLKNMFWGSKKSIWGPKRPILVSYRLNWAIWGPLRLGYSLDGPFFWSMPWEMWPDVDLKHFRHQKTFLGGSRKSI